MNAILKLHTNQFSQKKQQLTYMIVGCVVVMIVFNILLDYWFTQFHNSAFYITEALLFSTHWVFYLPLLFLLLKMAKRTENIWTRLAFTGCAIFIHMTAYPALVWVLSGMFYNHTFEYWQTFNFGLSAYFIKSVLIYGFPLFALSILEKRIISSPTIEKTKDEPNPKNFISSVVITASNNTKLLLAVNDIFYIASNSPYVSIYHLSKKYLHAETLKSLEHQLDGNQFVRIHKSHIVNLQKITSYQSRQNGDYDIYLSDGSVLRLSRNYAKDFKSKFEQCTRLMAN